MGGRKRRRRELTVDDQTAMRICMSLVLPICSTSQCLFLFWLDLLVLLSLFSPSNQFVVSSRHILTVNGVPNTSIYLSIDKAMTAITVHDVIACFPHCFPFSLHFASFSVSHIGGTDEIRWPPQWRVDLYDLIVSISSIPFLLCVAYTLYTLMFKVYRLPSTVHNQKCNFILTPWPFLCEMYFECQYIFVSILSFIRDTQSNTKCDCTYSLWNG